MGCAVVLGVVQKHFSRGAMAAPASEQLSAAQLLGNFFEQIVMKGPSLSMLHEAAHSTALVCAAMETLQCATPTLAQQQKGTRQCTIISRCTSARMALNGGL